MYVCRCFGVNKGKDFNIWIGFKGVFYYIKVSLFVLCIVDGNSFIIIMFYVFDYLIVKYVVNIYEYFIVWFYKINKICFYFC